VIKNIVLAIDGSTNAAHAQEVAIDLANKYAAQLTIVHVLTRDHPSKEFARMAEMENLDEANKPQMKDKENTYSAVARFIGGAREAKEARVIALLGEQIVNAASANARKAGIGSVNVEIHDGDYANRILEVAEKVGADIIVMGRRGLSNLKGFVTGSVSHKVAQRSDCSVLTVK